MPANSAEILKRRCQPQNGLELTLARSGKTADENRMHFLLADRVQGAGATVLARTRRGGLPGSRQLRTRQRRARGQRADLLIAHVPRGPPESAVRVHRQLLGPAHREHAADTARDLLRALRVEALHVHDARPELPVLAELLPKIELRELAPRELQYQLVGAALEDAGEVRAIGAVEPGTSEAIAEADVEGELGLHALGGHVVEARHLLAAHVAAGRLVELDEVRPRCDEPLELRVDHLREALRHVHHALVHPAGMDSRAEGERPRAGGLGGAGGVGLQVLELLDDAEPAVRRLDAPGRLVARLLIVAPRSRLAPDRQGLDPLDDRVVGVDVAVEPAHLPVGDDVEARALHVADRGVGRVVEHLLEVRGAHRPRLVGLDRGVPPAGLAVRADHAGGDQRKSGHLRVLLWVVSGPPGARTPASMLSPADLVNGDGPPAAVTRPR